MWQRSQFVRIVAFTSVLETIIKILPRRRTCKLTTTDVRAFRSPVRQIAVAHGEALESRTQEWISICAANTGWFVLRGWLQLLLLFLGLFPWSGSAGMVLNIILPLCSVQYVLLLLLTLSIYLLHESFLLVFCLLRVTAAIEQLSFPNPRQYVCMLLLVVDLSWSTRCCCWRCLTVLHLWFYDGFVYEGLYCIDCLFSLLDRWCNTNRSSIRQVRTSRLTHWHMILKY